MKTLFISMLWCTDISLLCINTLHFCAQTYCTFVCRHCTLVCRHCTFMYRRTARFDVQTYCTLVYLYIAPWCTDLWRYCGADASLWYTDISRWRVDTLHTGVHFPCDGCHFQSTIATSSTTGRDLSSMQLLHWKLSVGVGTFDTDLRGINRMYFLCVQNLGHVCFIWWILLIHSEVDVFGCAGDKCHGMDWK